MKQIAPNLSEVVGPTIAAQLVGATGGVEALAALPAGNVLLVGAHQLSSKELGGLSTLTKAKHEGFIATLDLIKDLPKELRKKGQRLLAGKSVLAARMDSSFKLQAERNNEYGKELREKIERTIDKWLEPALLKREKPLPVPKEYLSKKRGGKRVRRVKELTAMTEVRKIQNRMAFGVIGEHEVQASDTVKGLGMLYQSGAGGKMRIQESSKGKEHVKQQAQKAYSKFSL